MYRCAIIGASGARASGHAEAYKHIKRGKLLAASARTRDKLLEFGDRFQIRALYGDYREMLLKERPDLVHVNTPPTVRLEVLVAAAEAGVPAIILEKPVAIQGEDWLALDRFARGAEVKVAVNHQLHFHPRRRELQRLVRDGVIGDVLFTEASARMNLAYQGTHLLEAIGAFNHGARPTSVFAQLSGAEGLRESPRKHFAPDRSLAAITYDTGARAQLQCGTNAPVVGSGRISRHKRIAVYTTRGHLDWTMSSWAVYRDGTLEVGDHDYPDEDILGQAALTESMFDWLEDDAAVHPTNLGSSLRDFNVVLGIYMSALRRQVVALPIHPEANLIQALRLELGGTALPRGEHTVGGNFRDRSPACDRG